MSTQCNIVGMGAYVPNSVCTNKDLEKVMDTTDEWIVSRTGIKSRHILDPADNNSDMATRAAKKALDDANISIEEVTHLFVATCTPDAILPSTACYVAAKLEEATGVALSRKAVCMDINAACSGFLYALEMSRAFLCMHPDSVILLISSEALSRRLNYEDRSTAVLFGDGAAAVVVKSQGEAKLSLLDISLGSDGKHTSLIHAGGGTAMKAKIGTPVDADFFLTMQGRDVFKHAVRCMAQECLDLLGRHNLTIDDVGLFIPHQANIRIIEAVGTRIGIDIEKVFINLDKFGNTSAASIPLALCDAKSQGRFPSDKIILVATFGAGLTWGAAIFK